MKKLALFMLTMLMVFTLAACGDNVSITKTEAAAVETEVYECSDFSMTIPKGWVVTSGGTNIYHSIRVYDPSEPINQMFVLLKADCLLHSKAGKEAWQSNYEMGNAQAEMMAKAPVLSNPSTEGFFKIFGKYTDFVSDVEPSYAGYEFPRFDNFKVTEKFDSTSNLKSYALGDKILRATFTDGDKNGEGMFAASVVDFGSFTISNGKVVGYQNADRRRRILYGIQHNGCYGSKGQLHRMGGCTDELHENFGIFRQLCKHNEPGKQRKSRTCKPNKPEFQPSNGWNYVIMGKQKQESGHYEPKAE